METAGVGNHSKSFVVGNHQHPKSFYDQPALTLVLRYRPSVLSVTNSLAHISPVSKSGVCDVPGSYFSNKENLEFVKHHLVTMTSAFHL